jgi:hypothetical protein
MAECSGIFVVFFFLLALNSVNDNVFLDLA